MTSQGIARLLAGLGAASGRALGQSEAVVYFNVLDGVSDEVGEEAGRRLWPHVSWENPPSPRLVKEQVNAIMRHETAVRPALPEDTSPVSSPEASTAAIAELRARLATAKGPLAAGLRRTAGPIARGDGGK